MPFPPPVTGRPGELARCAHVRTIHPVEPSSTQCQDCVGVGVAWADLSLCLSCGWVACTDASSGRHARAHYEETDHPVAVPLRAGTPRPWCYVHERAV